MKRTLSILLSGVSTLGALSASAEPPSQPVAPTYPPQVQTERASYMGVTTWAASPTIREQLGLRRGTGLVVEMVDPHSPAELAGLLPNDVIVQMNDQLVVNVQQLSVLVRLQKPGETVTLHVLRHGQPTDVKVQLAERVMPVLEEQHLMLPPILLPHPGVGRSCVTITHVDGDDEIKLITRDSDRHLTIKNAAGEMLYDGPLNTPEDEAKVPAGLQEKLKRVLAKTKQFKDLIPPGGN
jgi:hypothetical protein